ncbi:Fructokinase-2 [Nymphaea thermarum]|nr:Fructokinase-2 [Nymphaea thermarum]
MGLPLPSNLDGTSSAAMWKLNLQASEGEDTCLTNGEDCKREEVALWQDGLTLMVVTDGEKGCRYFAKFDKDPNNG